MIFRTLAGLLLVSCAVGCGGANPQETADSLASQIGAQSGTGTTEAPTNGNGNGNGQGANNGNGKGNGKGQGNSNAGAASARR